MDTATKLKQALKEAIGANPNLPITAKVVSIQGTTCTVRLVGELKISDVRLCATINEDADGLVIIPKIGSEVVIISQTGTLSGMMVVKVDAVETVTYKKADFEFIVDGTTGKVTLKKSGANFGGLMNELIDAISGMQTLNSDMTTGVLQPAVIAQLTAIKTKFNLILNTV
jgi:phage tail sheath gpL-like